MISRYPKILLWYRICKLSYYFILFSKLSDNSCLHQCWFWNTFSVNISIVQSRSELAGCWVLICIRFKALYHLAYRLYGVIVTYCLPGTRAHLISPPTYFIPVWRVRQQTVCQRNSQQTSFHQNCQFIQLSACQGLMWAPYVECQWLPCYRTEICSRGNCLLGHT